MRTIKHKTSVIRKSNIAVFFVSCLLMTACSDNKETETSLFIENAGILENGELLSPGSIVHLEGRGYLDNDDVILNFFWETGDKLIPEGKIIGYRATIISKSYDGMTIQMPYRKPASRVEANLFRNGEIMYIGSVNLTSGLTPKELNLYGVYNETKIKTSLEKQITRWIDGDYYTNDLNSWALDLHPDFHSAVGAYRAYGICGLSKENDKQYPFFLDLCSQEWSRLSDNNTIALFSDGTVIGAIQSFDGDLYGINVISEELDRSEDYLTSRSDMPQPATMKYKLPEGVEAAQFGEFPGAYYSGGVLLSANKGNGKWTPVFFRLDKGFTVLDEIEAKRLIPYAVRSISKTENGNSMQWISGFIAVKEKADNGCHSLLYVVDDNLSMSQDPIASFTNQALSAAANHDRPGTLTVHFEALRSGNVTLEYSFDKQEWTPINEFGTFDEIVWIN